MLEICQLILMTLKIYIQSKTNGLYVDYVKMYNYLYSTSYSIVKITRARLIRIEGTL